MLIPLTRTKFEQIIPLIATGPQYAYFWGKPSVLVRRLLISMVAIVVLLIVGQVLGNVSLLLAVIGGLYWLWSPVYLASRKNVSYRRYPYSGFWRGKILDLFITEEIVGEEQKVNQRGELVVVENRERRLNVVIGDQTGFEVEIQAPLKRIYKTLAPGQTAELVLLSNQDNLARIEAVTDAYVPSQNIWVGDYPWLQRDIFVDVSRQLGENSAPSSNRPNRRRR
jgi:hypothetical protein